MTEEKLYMQCDDGDEAELMNKPMPQLSPEEEAAVRAELDLIFSEWEKSVEGKPSVQELYGLDKYDAKKRKY